MKNGVMKRINKRTTFWGNLLTFTNILIYILIFKINHRPLLASMENEIQNLLKDDVDNNNDFFREEFELDLTDESYSKIDVPNFREGRRGRFLHDFKFNQSAIIDNDYNNCFIMDLDRETVLPPRSMYDLITKMWRGYYNIDTNVIRQNMRVVTPAITNYDDISQKIVSECDKMKIYKLEKLVSGGEYIKIIILFRSIV